MESGRTTSLSAELLLSLSTNVWYHFKWVYLLINKSKGNYFFRLPCFLPNFGFFPLSLSPLLFCLLFFAHNAVATAKKHELRTHEMWWNWLKGKFSALRGWFAQKINCLQHNSIRCVGAWAGTARCWTFHTIAANSRHIHTHIQWLSEWAERNSLAHAIFFIWLKLI